MCESPGASQAPVRICISWQCVNVVASVNVLASCEDAVGEQMLTHLHLELII